MGLVNLDSIFKPAKRSLGQAILIFVISAAALGLVLLIVGATTGIK